VTLRVVDSELYHSMSRGRHRRAGDVPSLMDLPSDSDVTPRRDAEVLSALTMMMMMMMMMTMTMTMTMTTTMTTTMMMTTGLLRLL